MKVVIDIPNDMIKSLEQGSFGAKYNMYDLVGCVMNGTPLPKGHGDLIDRKTILKDIEALQKSPWYNDERAMKTEYLIHEAVETVRDLCVKDAPTIIPAERRDDE